VIEALAKFLPAAASAAGPAEAPSSGSKPAIST
jgi:hypothetical protein